MTQLKLFKIISLILGVMNLILLAMFLMAPPPPHLKNKGLKDIVAKELQLSTDQKKIYTASTITHRQQMRRLNRKEHRLVLDYFKILIEEDTELDKENLLKQIKAIEGEKIEVTYEHFEELKAICDEKQEKRFPRVMRKAIKFLVIRNN